MQDIAEKPAAHPPAKHGKVGVLLVNLGTPDGTDYASMRRYLKEFLTDKRVIEWPKIACSDQRHNSGAGRARRTSIGAK